MGGFLNDISPSHMLNKKLYEEIAGKSKTVAEALDIGHTLFVDPGGIFLSSFSDKGREMQATLDIGGIGAKPAFEAQKQQEQQQVLLDTIAESLGPKETLTLKGGAPSSGTTTTLGEEDAKKKRRALRNIKQGTKQLQIPLETTTSQGISATTDTGLKV